MIEEQDKTVPTSSRRDFIRRLSVLAGSAALVGSLPWISSLKAEEPHAGSDNNKINVAVLGTGSRGRYLQLFLQSNPKFNLVALCDDYQPHLDLAVKQLSEDKGVETLTDPKQVKTFLDYKKLLSIKGLEAIVVATPLHLHAEMTMAALKKGIHVFCEKSMAWSVEDCKAMVEVQQETGLVLQVGHQRMFDIRYLKMLDMVRSGQIGQLGQIRAYWHRNNDWRRQVPEDKPQLERKINWRLYDEYSRGLMTELASHQIQVANWVYDEFPVSVQGYGSTIYWKDGREVYDNVNLVYRYPSKRHLIYDSMTSNKHYGLEEQIMGDKGTLEPESNKMYVEEPPPAPGILQLIHSIEKGVFEAVPVGGASWVPETAVTYEGDYILHPSEEEGFISSSVQFDGFAESIRNNQVNKELLEQAYYASIWSLLGHQAMKERREVKFEEKWAI